MFATNYPDGIKAETLAQVFDKTAYQLRHMMVENKEQQKQILDESLDYLGKLYTEEMKGQKGATAGSVYQTEMMKLDKRKVNMPEKLVIQSLALSIDSRAFICKFRQ